MGGMGKFSFYFLLLVIFPIAFIAVHELTHAALNDFNFQSFCFLNCADKKIAETILYNPQPIATNEEMPTATGLLAGAWILKLAFDCL